MYVMVVMVLSLLPAVGEATAACRQWQSSRTNCCDKSLDDRKPPPYKHVKASVIIESVLYTFRAVVMPCVCYLHQGGYVFVVVCLLSVSSSAQILPNGFA